MTKIYLAISFSKLESFNEEIASLRHFFEKKNMELFVFVDHYNFESNQEKEMMETAFEEINSSGLLIAELTTKSIGVGIEIGYAFAMQKPIIYLHREGSEHSTTASGCSTYSIEYKDTNDLTKQLERCKLTTFTPQN
jgi:nucleoside 2-deoxyribosyltransferase